GGRQALVEWNDTASPVPEGCVHDLIAQQARRRPDAIAVVAGDGSLRFGELDQRVEALAARLAAAGSGPGKLVALCLERTTDLVVGLLAVLRSGAAYLPLDPAYPGERLRHILGHSSAIVLLAHRSALPRAGRLAAPP